VIARTLAEEAGGQPAEIIAIQETGGTIRTIARVATRRAAAALEAVP
jgi:hypothetical protein